MASFQQTIIIGNVGRDPEFKYTQSGVALCNFSVAVTERFGGKDGSEKKEETTWYRCTAWRQQAEVANQYVKKGMSIQCVGKVKASAYTNKEGQPAASLELTVTSFQFLSKVEGGGQRDFDEPPDYVGANVSDIPF
jgi:single-strand DNA-binding protein